MKQLLIGVVILILIGLSISFFSGDSEGSFFSELKELISGGNHDDDDDEDDDDIDSKQQLINGSLVVRIPKETQQFAGIKTRLTENISVQSEDRAFSTVIDIKDLLEQRSAYRNVLAQRQITNTAFKNSTKSLEQLKILRKEANNISARKLQQAQSKWEEDRARIRAADIELQNIRENMTQKWNTSITDLALKEHSKIFERLINREEYLILVSLKAEQELSSNTAFVFVNRSDNRNQARKAYFISAAPFSDKTLQGETYFFRTNADKVRIGMRLYVWLPDTGFTGEGVNIPAEAIVWYAGRPWAYVQVEDELFSRRSLLNPIQTSDSWLVKENFEIGERIVISGAQTLLSEEFKGAIPDEDDD